MKMKMSRDDFFKLFKNQTYVDQLKQIPQKFNVIHNEEEKKTEITIYGVIGFSWWEDCFSAKDIDKALKEAGDNDVVINLNSPGGDVFDGIAIYNRLKRHNGKVTIHVDGWACSAASVIAMAADELIMGLGSMFMYHEASSIVWGTKTDMRKEADVLHELEEGIIDIYMTKTNLSREEIRTNLDAETWLSAKKAVEQGFADKVEGDMTDGSDDSATITNVATRSIEEKQQILNELKNTLKQSNESNQEPSPVQKEKGSFNLLKKWTN